MNPIKGTHGTHVAPTWLEVLIKNLDMEKPCTLRPTIIEAHLQGRHLEKSGNLMESSPHKENLPPQEIMVKSTPLYNSQNPLSQRYAQFL